MNISASCLARGSRRARAVMVVSALMLVASMLATLAQAQPATPLPLGESELAGSSGSPSSSETPRPRSSPSASLEGATAQALPSDSPTYDYIDVNYDHFAALDIAALAGDGILAGTDCQEGRFCPEMAIQRWQIAVWIVRVLDGGDPTPRTSRFTDIEGRPWWDSHVERLAELGVTIGCHRPQEPERFCPTDTVTRDQMAAFLDRAFDLADQGTAGFVDTDGAISKASIDRVYHAGITRGCSAEPLRFCPERVLTRAQMAAMLNRARFVSVDVSRIQFRDAAHRLAFTEDPPPTTSAVLAVYYCGPRDTFTRNDLTQEISRLAVIWSFYSSQSNGQSRIEFAHGGIVSPDEAADDATWSSESIDKWVDAGYRGPCYDEVYDIERTNPFAIIADVHLDDTHGYGVPLDPDAQGSLKLTGHIVVPTRTAYERAGKDPLAYDYLVAHEIGHLLSLCHTFDEADNCKRFQGTDPRVKESCDFSNMCNGDSNLWNLAASVMSYTQYGAHISLSDSYVACRQKLWLGWIDACDPPDPPGTPRVTAGDGEITVAWEKPEDNGSPITGFAVDFKNTAVEVSEWSTIRVGESSRSHTIPGLSNGDEYEVRVRAINNAGESDPSPEVFATPEPGGRGAFTAIAAGERHSCGLRTGGAIECWGSSTDWAGGYFGQAVHPAGTYTTISAGFVHSCALTTAGDAVCWGEESAADAPAGTYTTITAGGFHSCAVTTAGDAVCWGNNYSGQNTAHTDVGKYTTISGGYGHSCALTTAGDAVCWGDNFYGQLDAPTGKYTAISAGERHSCALTTAGDAVCWGSKTKDYGHADALHSGQADAPAGTYTAISAGYLHSCALTTAGDAVCWGSNWAGQTDVPAGTYTAISAGRAHTCAVTTAGAAVCWGSNSQGQTDAPV